MTTNASMKDIKSKKHKKGKKRTPDPNIQTLANNLVINLKVTWDDGTGIKDCDVEFEFGNQVFHVRTKANGEIDPFSFFQTNRTSGIVVSGPNGMPPYFATQFELPNGIMTSQSFSVVLLKPQPLLK